MIKKPRILFITHETARTGAPIVLLELLKWLKGHSDIQFDVLVKKDGELTPEFRKIAKVFRYKITPVTHILKAPLINRVFNPFLKKWIPLKMRANRYDLVFANSISSTDLAYQITSGTPSKLFLYVHEMEMVTEQTFGLDRFRDYVNRVDLFLTVSEAVTRFLKLSFHLSGERVQKVNAFIRQPVKAANPVDFRPLLKLPDNSFIVGSSGTMDWRKGFDLMPQIVKAVVDQNPAIHFVWLGSARSEYDPKRMMQDAKRFGVDKHIHLIFSKPNPYDYYAGFDVFLLPSREDPFPLVCLENAALGKPIIHFKGSGGMDEFVKPTFGVAVDFFDVNKLVTEIQKLFHSKETIGQMGLKSKEAVAFYSVEQAAKQIHDLIDGLITK